MSRSSRRGLTAFKSSCHVGCMCRVRICLGQNRNPNVLPFFAVHLTSLQPYFVIEVTDYFLQLVLLAFQQQPTYWQAFAT